MGARVYDPVSRRFVQADNVDLKRYTYADGDPINNLDPSGHNPRTLCQAGDNCTVEYVNPEGYDVFRAAIGAAGIRNSDPVTDLLPFVGTYGDNLSAMDRNQMAAAAAAAAAQASMEQVAGMIAALGGDMMQDPRLGSMTMADIRAASSLAPATGNYYVGGMDSTDELVADMFPLNIGRAALEFFRNVGWGVGVSLDLSTINPFSSGNGGDYGYNLEYTSSTGLHLYGFGTPNGTGSGGFEVGVSIQVNFALGTGDWTGPFNQMAGGYGVLAASAFGSPGPAPCAGYCGASIGFGFGPPGLGVTQTNYGYVFSKP